MTRCGVFIVLVAFGVVAAYGSRRSFYNTTLQEAWCREAAVKLRPWVTVLTFAPFAINLCSIVMIIFTIVYVRRLKSVTEAITSSTHWLTRTATRVGLGSSAHRSLIEYARSKGYVNLIPHPRDRCINSE